MSFDGPGRPSREFDDQEETVSNIVVSQFVTLDGVFEDPGGSEKLERGGWALQFDRGPEGDKFELDEVMESDALLLGRVTYEGFAEAWPSREGEFADKSNGIPKYVVSTTFGTANHSNSRPASSDHSRMRMVQEVAGPDEFCVADRSNST